MKPQDYNLTVPQLAEAIVMWLHNKGEKLPAKVNVEIDFVKADNSEQGMIKVQVTDNE